LYAGIESEVRVTSVAVAEMVKYVCNCWRAVKVGFANEIGNLSNEFGIDSHEVMSLFCEDTQLNLSAKYLMPGFAFGGSCLPKDLRALAYRGRQLDVPTPMLSAALDSNQKQIARAFELVTGTGKKRIGVLGMAFKAGTDDLRESPVVTLIEQLLGKGFQLAIYDGDVSASRLMGSNREYIEREIPHIWTLVRDSIEEVIAASDVVVIGNGSPEFREIAPLLTAGQTVIDLVRALDGTKEGVAYQGICW
jgi:GDP-mannose 6-dehydrogenase